MSDQDGDLPEVNDGPPAENEPLSACPIDPEERLDTERVLGLFAPRTPRLKRERLLALVQSVRRGVEPAATKHVRFRTPWYWPAATAAMTATSVSLAVLLVVRANAEPPVRVEYKERIVYQPVSLPSTPPSQPTKEREDAVVAVPQPDASVEQNPSLPTDYVTSRGIALSQGVEALDFRQPMVRGGTPNSPATGEELLRQLGPTKPAQQGMTKSLQTGMTNKSWIWPSW